MEICGVVRYEGWPVNLVAAVSCARRLAAAIVILFSAKPACPQFHVAASNASIQ